MGSEGAGGSGAEAVAWRRLGFLSFDPNERSQFAARELKSVALAGPEAGLVRLVIHRCHANALNPQGQVRRRRMAPRGSPGALEPSCVVVGGTRQAGRGCMSADGLVSDIRCPRVLVSILARCAWWRSTS